MMLLFLTEIHTADSIIWPFCFLSDYDSLNEEDVAGNNQLAFDVAEQAFGIQPVIRGEEMAVEAEPDKLLMVLYLSKFYEAFRNSPGNDNGQLPSCLCHSQNRLHYFWSSEPLSSVTGVHVGKEVVKIEGQLTWWTY